MLDSGQNHVNKSDKIVLFMRGVNEITKNTVTALNKY